MQIESAQFETIKTDEKQNFNWLFNQTMEKSRNVKLEKDEWGKSQPNFTSKD